MKASIKTVDIQAKEWFDNVNGNSYFSAQVVINYGLPSEKTLYIPMEYGYGDCYETQSFKAIQKNINKKSLKGLSPHLMVHVWCDNNNIILRTSKHENQKKAAVVAWGEK